MSSTAMMYVLIAEYLLIAGASVWEGNWPRAVYFVSASALTVSVIWMKG